jgi:phosphate transport system substrate-binding protein
MVNGANKVLAHVMAVALACTLMPHVARAAQPLACAGVGVDGVDPALPAYKPKPFELPNTARYIAPDGAVVVVGYNDMRGILSAMASTFSATHRRVRFRFDLPGTRFAPTALAKGLSAFAPMGALFTPSQLEDYRSVTGSEPLAVRIAHASLNPRALSGPLAVFVHRDNPIQSLTLAQLAKVFAGEVTHWRELGLGGDWGERGINAYGLQPGTALAFELQQAVMPNRPFGTRVVGVPQSAEVTDKVAVDLSAIGFAAAMRARPGVRALAIAAREGAEPVPLTCESIVTGHYPLDRHLLIYLPRPIPPVAREFVRFALSREGQQAVVASPQRYLPLSARDAAAELAKLE